MVVVDGRLIVGHHLRAAHRLLGRAKDLGSAAVMLSLWLVAGTWAAALWP